MTESAGMQRGLGGVRQSLWVVLALSALLAWVAVAWTENTWTENTRTENRRTEDRRTEDTSADAARTLAIPSRAVDDDRDKDRTAERRAVGHQDRAADERALPEKLGAPQWPRSSFDPFVGVVEPPPRAAPKPMTKPPTPAPQTLVQTAPIAPAVNYRYLGQMFDVEGKRLVWLSRGGPDMVPVEVGTPLDDGFAVKAMSAHEIRLEHVATGAVVAVPIPDAESTGQ